MSKRKPEGISRVRVNKKTLEKEYKASYRFVDLEGNIRQSETMWCNSPSLALKLKKQALRQRKEDFLMGKKQKKEINNKKLEELFLEFMDSLQKRIDLDNPNVQQGGKISELQSAKTIYNKYFPNNVRSIKIKDIVPSVFSKWLNYINNTKLSGKSVRKYKSALKSFNRYLDNEGLYLDEDLHDLIIIKMDNVKLKKKEEAKRFDRHTPTLEDLKKITAYYKAQEKGLGRFRNFYWYTFWTVLFFTGVRPGELLGLRWCDVSFSSDEGTIKIRNAVNEKEKAETAVKRASIGAEFLKRTESKRTITMFAAYKQLLEDYQENLFIKFPDTNKKYGFVFPRFNSRSKKEKHFPQRHKNALNEIKKVCKEIDIPHTDVQMFRHGCATFLIRDKGLMMEDMFNYFGHQDTTMLAKIYAELTPEDKMHKANVKLKELISKNDLKANIIGYDTSDLEVGNELENRISTARRQRVLNEILNGLEKGQEMYDMPKRYQNLSDDDIKYIEAHGYVWTGSEFLKKDN